MYWSSEKRRERGAVCDSSLNSFVGKGNHEGRRKGGEGSSVESEYVVIA